jgi:hypothetical protein
MPAAMIQPNHRNRRSGGGQQMNSSCPVSSIWQQRGAATAIEINVISNHIPKVLSRKVIEEEITCRL